MISSARTRRIGIAAGALMLTACGKRAMAEEPAASRVEILAEGPLAKVEEPFVAVIRGAAAFVELRAAAGLTVRELPENRFASRAVVAVFLGARSTPGYRVSVRSHGAKLEIVEDTPPADTIQAQMVTFPFVVASVPLDKDGDLAIELPTRLRSELRRYRLASGELELSGGIAGRASKVGLSGEARVARLGRLVTAMLDLRAAGPGQGNAGSLTGVLTGLASGDGTVSFGTIAGASLVPPPCPTLAVHGKLADGGDLSIRLTSRPCAVPDAFTGVGVIELTPPER